MPGTLNKYGSLLRLGLCMRPKSLKMLFLFKITIGCVIVCLAVAGTIACQKKNPSDVVLPGRHLSQSQASSLAIAALPPLPVARGFKARYKDGYWEISAVDMIESKDHKSASFGTNSWVLAAKVRDSDRKVEIITNE